MKLCALCVSVLIFTQPVWLFAQQQHPQNFLLTADSLHRYPHYINKGWKFTEGDDPAMALPGYDDSHWKETNPALYVSDTTEIFKGIGWFRLHIISDTSVKGKPLAMTMTHLGASEIYLDGKLLKSFGTINGPDSSQYFDPREVPFVFTVDTPREHLIAVRYANYNAEKNFKTYRQPQAGFEMMMGAADNYIYLKNQRSTVISFLLVMLSGIFLTLCLIHLFLYFYHRADRSNLFFSIFVFCIETMFLIGFIAYANTTPLFVMKSVALVTYLLIIACVSLAGFTNALFAKGKWRFRMLTAVSVIAFIMHMMRISIAPYLVGGLVIGVSFDTVITIIFRIVQRVKGASIIGTGLLFFTLFILILSALGIASGGKFDIDDSKTSGQVLETFLALAILSIPVSMSLYQAWRFANINRNLALQLEQVQVLSQKTIAQEQEKKKILESQKEKLEEEVTLRTAELREEKKKSDDLLLNILPSEVADELKTKGSADAKHFDEVTVLFTDFKNFTNASERLTPQELVNEINYCYSEFDKIISGYGIEKIKTIGDAYMCAGGLPVPNKTNAEDCVRAALEIRDFISSHSNSSPLGRPGGVFEIRIGIHTGPVVAGIVGIKKFAYDIWGDTVNIASRMESSGEVGKVNISEVTYNLVKDKFKCEHRGKVEAKNKGVINMYFVENAL